MHIRHQRGYLRCVKRKNGPSVWEFLWQEDAKGKRLRRTAVIGTVEEYPTEDLAVAAVNNLKKVEPKRLSIVMVSPSRCLF
ncbi:MAG: hypothetical protein M3410_15535 [Acidobacteriota bacterium]|nr:hypothetical protein [Acidobacteriota bacterium]